MRLQSLLPVLLLFPVLGTAQAQSNLQPTPDSQTTQSAPAGTIDERGFVKAFVKDEVHIWASPFKGSSYSSHAFKKYVIPFIVITGALVATDHKTENLLPNTIDQSRWSGRVSQLGAPYTLVGMTAATYLISRKTQDKKLKEASLLGAEAIAHSQLVTLILKSATQRERPLDFRANHDGGIAFGKGGDSFPSGHSSGSFALATVFSYEYGHDHRWVPFASYGLASVVAASRLSAQKHWVSDIFVGGTTGFLIGRYVYKAHHDTALDGSPRSATEKLVPQFGLTAHGGSAVWTW